LRSNRRDLARRLPRQAREARSRRKSGGLPKRTPGSGGRTSSRPLALRTARSGGRARENGLGNLIGQRAAGLLQLHSRRLDILGNAFFRFLEGGLRGSSRGVDGGLAFVQSAPPLGFLLGKNFGAGFLHCFIIDTLLFVRRNAAGFGLNPCAFG